MASLSEELLTVLKEAERAQQLEQDSDINAAADTYYTAACQLSYLIDMHVDKGSILDRVCLYLVNMYQQRLMALRSKLTVAEESHWVQLEQDAAARGQLVSLSRGSVASTTTHAGVLPAGVMCTLPNQHAAAVQVAMLAAGAGGMQSHFTNVSMAGQDSEGGDGTQVSCEQDPQSAIELLRMCQRAVSGTLDDVIGLEEVKEEIEEAILLPMQHPYLFKGIRQPARTFLLYGPPGTGKTMLVEKVAAEAELHLLSISPSMILSKWSGDSEKAISQVFDLARTMQPALLFMDEIDSIGQSRDNNTDPGSRRLLTELLIQFNRASEEDGIYIFAATNRMQDCDQALLRRFSRRIEVPLPTAGERQAFFQSMLNRPEVDAAIDQGDMQQLAQQTHGYSGSDLAAVCRLAAMAPVRELFQQQRQQCKGRKRRRLHTAQCGRGDEGLQRLVEQGTQHPGNSGVQTDQATGTQQDTSNTGCKRHQQQPLSDRMDLPEAPAEAEAGLIHQQQLGPSANSGAAGTEQLQVRPLVYADFTAALEKVKPAGLYAQATAQL